MGRFNEIRIPGRAPKLEEIQLPRRERGQHDPVVIVDEVEPPLADGGTGWPVTHARIIDVIGGLFEAGDIDRDDVRAAINFRTNFHRGALVGCGAIDPTRIAARGKPGSVIDEIEDARQHVYHAMVALGGLASPAGSAIWNVVGNEKSISEWAMGQQFGKGRSLDRKVAKGIVICALSVLVLHYDHVGFEGKKSA